MKNVQNLRNSLKFKADVSADALAIVIDGKPRLLRGSEARVLAGSRFAYISAPAFSHIVEIGDDEVRPFPDDYPVEEIEAELLPLVEQPRKRRDPAAEADLPEELKDVLRSAIPAGYRLQMDRAGEMKLVKTRNRKGVDEDLAG